MTPATSPKRMRSTRILYIVLFLLACAAPFVIYPIFLMKVLCFALFACAFNLLIGFTGLLSFGHAMFFGCAVMPRKFGG
jgi:branched-chain amino acid transport system permease protein